MEQESELAIDQCALITAKNLLYNDNKRAL